MTPQWGKSTVAYSKNIAFRDEYTKTIKPAQSFIHNR